MLILVWSFMYYSNSTDFIVNFEDRKGRKFGSYRLQLQEVLS